MVKKMYFPRSILVVSQLISNYITTLIGYAVVLLAIYLAGQEINIYILLLPIVLILIFLFVLGYSLFFSALTVYLRDIQYFLSTVSIVFYFMTPMYFTLDSISGTLRTLVYLNPFTYYVDALHQIVYYAQVPKTMTMLVCIFLPVVSIVVGSITFNKLKKGFAERL